MDLREHHQPDATQNETQQHHLPRSESVRQPTLHWSQHRTTKPAKRSHARNQCTRPTKLILDSLEENARRLKSRPRTYQHVERARYRHPPAEVDTSSRTGTNCRQPLMKYRQCTLARVPTIGLSRPMGSATTNYQRLHTRICGLGAPLPATIS